MNQNKTNLHITNSNPPKSPSKPIKKQQLLKSKFGTGLMVNISTHQTNKRQISSESIASNSNTISTSNNTIQRLSNSTDNSTPHSHSNSNSLDIDNNNNIHNIPSLKTQPSDDDIGLELTAGPSGCRCIVKKCVSDFTRLHVVS
eukprot:452435_1